DGRGIGVQNGRERPGETRLHGGAGRFAIAQFLAHAFEDEHVGIHRHAEGENDAGNPWQGQCGPQARHRQDTHDNDEIEPQRNRRNEAREAIVYQQKHDNQAASQYCCTHPFNDRITAERRSNGTVFHNRDWRREGSLTQHDRQVTGFFRGETPRNTCLASRNRLLNNRRREDGVIEHDGHRLAHVLASDALEDLLATAIEPHEHVILPTALVWYGARVGQHVATHGSPALDKERPGVNELTSPWVFL